MNTLDMDNRDRVNRYGPFRKEMEKVYDGMFFMIRQHYLEGNKDECAEIVDKLRETFTTRTIFEILVDSGKLTDAQVLDLSEFMKGYDS